MTFNLTFINYNTKHLLNQEINNKGNPLPIKKKSVQGVSWEN